ncbi:hypothetical protein GCM10009836_22090 [Pseudonocardia ailaonensis]|uniref:Uncharacterized protein n=1 Tax=Pseudonocardia ailaonensis TaxID=367279 RepID=A0ABN2MX18_9PSEU
MTGSPKRPNVGQIVCGVLGLLTLATGITATFVLGSNAAIVVVLVVGTALLLVAALGPSLSELSVGSSGVTLKLTQDATNAGAPRAASEFDDSGLSEFAEAYTLVNSELRDSAFTPARLHLQDSLVERARVVGLRGTIPTAEVRRLFLNGSPVLRTLSIGLMKGDPAAADPQLLSSAVAEPLSANEQYHALRLIAALWTRWQPTDRERLKQVVAATYYSDVDRQAAARAILALPTTTTLTAES